MRGVRACVRVRGEGEGREVRPEMPAGAADAEEVSTTETERSARGGDADFAPRGRISLHVKAVKGGGKWILRLVLWCTWRLPYVTRQHLSLPFLFLFLFQMRKICKRIVEQLILHWHKF